MRFDRRLLISSLGALGLVLSLLLVGYYLSTLAGCGPIFDYLRSLAPEIGAAGIGGVVIGSAIAVTVDQFASFRSWQTQRHRLARKRLSGRFPSLRSELERNSRNVDLRGFAFSDEAIEDSRIIRAQFGNQADSILNSVHLTDCSVISTSFGGTGSTAIIQNSKLTGSEFIRCRFEGATMTASAQDSEVFRATVFVQCQFIETTFKNQDLELATMNRCVFWGCHFDNIRLPGNLLQTMEARGWARRGNVAGTWDVLPLAKVIFSSGQTSRFRAIWLTLR
jgi:hypothetical protein